MTINQQEERTFTATEIAEVLPSGKVPPTRDPRLRRGRRYTELMLLISEMIFELLCRYRGDNSFLRVVSALSPRLPEYWAAAKSGRTVVIVIEDRGMKFELEALPRALARVRGDHEAVYASLARLRDFVRQQP